MNTTDHLAYRMYCDYVIARGLTPLDWHAIAPPEQSFWREYGTTVARRFAGELPPRRTARTVTVQRGVTA